MKNISEIKRGECERVEEGKNGCGGQERVLLYPISPSGASYLDHVIGAEFGGQFLF